MVERKRNVDYLREIDDEHYEIKKQKRIMEDRLKADSDARKKLKKNCINKKEFEEKKFDFLDKACFTDYESRGYVFTWQELIDIFDNLEQKNKIYNEYIPSIAQVKPYLDIDWKGREYQIDIDHFIYAVKETIMDFGEHVEHPIEEDDIFISECHRNNKFSFHIIVSTLHPTLVFEGTTYAKFFAIYVRDNIARYHPDYSELIDLNPYKNGQNFRFIGHIKRGEDKPLVISEYSSKRVVQKDYPELEHFLTFFPCDKKMIKVHEQDDMENTVLKYKQNKNDKFLEISEEEKEMITNLVIDKCHPTAFYTRTDQNGFLQYNYNDREEYCFTSNCTHDSLGFFVFKNQKKEYIAGCYSSRCSDEKGSKILRVIGSEIESYGDNQNAIDFRNINFEIPWHKYEQSIEDGIYGCSLIINHIYCNPPRIKFCSPKTYYFWDGYVWKEDETSGKIQYLITKTLIEVFKYFINRLKLNKQSDKESCVTFNSDYNDILLKKSDEISKKISTLKESPSILKSLIVDTCDDKFRDLVNITPNHLAIKQGLINLKTGDIRQITPNDRITKRIELDYDPSEDYTLFDTFIKDITSDENGPRPELYNYFKWFIGYCIQGEPICKKFFVLYGPHGNNGKSILCDIILNVMSHYATTMDQSIVFFKGSKLPGSANPELMVLKNKYIGIITDTDADSRLNDGLMKKLTSGGDKISARALYENQTDFETTFVPIIASNHRFRINADDNAMMIRLVTLPFVLSFVNDPKKSYERKGNNNIKKELLENKKAILKWFIEAGHFYHENKDMPLPECVLKENEEYYIQMNTAQRFIRDYLIPSEEEKTLEDIYLSYVDFVDLEGGKKYSKNLFKKYLSEKFDIKMEKVKCTFK